MNGSLYWITESLPGLIWFALVYGLMGIPAACAALPRRQWSDHAAVGVLAIAFAPALLTAWLFILGTLGAVLKTPFLTPVPMLIGCGVIAAGLWARVWWKRNSNFADGDERASHDLPYQSSDKLLCSVVLCLLVIAVF